MKKVQHNFSLMALAAVLMLTPGKAAAQRTSYGEWMLSASVGTSFSHMGGAITFGMYQLPGYWFGEVNFMNRLDIPSNLNEKVYFPRLEAEGGYMFRIFADYNRVFNLYGGAGAFVGIELLDLYKTLTSASYNALIKGGYNEYQFVYGFSPRLEAEFFVLPALAIIGNIRLPFEFNSPFSIPKGENSSSKKVGIFSYCYEVSLGVKLNF